MHQDAFPNIPAAAECPSPACMPWDLYRKEACPAAAPGDAALAGPLRLRPHSTEAFRRQHPSSAYHDAAGECCTAQPVAPSARQLPMATQACRRGAGGAAPSAHLLAAVLRHGVVQDAGRLAADQAVAAGAARLPALQRLRAQGTGALGRHRRTSTRGARDTRISSCRPCPAHSAAPGRTRCSLAAMTDEQYRRVCSTEHSALSPARSAASRASLRARCWAHATARPAPRRAPARIPDRLCAQHACSHACTGAPCGMHRVPASVLAVRMQMPSSPAKPLIPKNKHAQL